LLTASVARLEEVDRAEGGQQALRQHSAKLRAPEAMPPVVEQCEPCPALAAVFFALEPRAPPASPSARCHRYA